MVGQIEFATGVFFKLHAMISIYRTLFVKGYAGAAVGFALLNGSEYVSLPSKHPRYHDEDNQQGCDKSMSRLVGELHLAQYC